jgi:polysaccharide export outer membrane protein
VIGTSAVRRVSSVVGIAIVSIALLCVTAQGWAQQAAGSDLSQQMQLFDNLSPDQQQALLQRLNGGDQTGLTGTGAVGTLGAVPGIQTNSSQSLLLQQLQLQQQRRLLSKLRNNKGLAGENPLNALNGINGLNALSQEPEIPVFEPGDTVLVTIELLPQTGATAPPPPPQPFGSIAGTLPQQQATLGAGTLQVQETPQRAIEELQAEEKRFIEDLIGHIQEHNPYEIDKNGELHLPGVPGMLIAGLTEELATKRVSAHPAFDKVQITLTRLPLEKFGKAALRPFGYDLFDNSIVGLLPKLNLPVPGDYIVGPGDVLQVQLYGTLNSNLRLTVGRNGEVSFPQIGPIAIAGERYSAVQNDIVERVNRQLIGTHASVSIGELRTISVFVAGSASYPGSYTVSSLATVSTALFAAGGVQSSGSLRSIVVKRQGDTVRTFDLYDLLMRGDTTNDIRLQDGDVVFVPPVGATASVDGEILRPAIYELRGNQSVEDLIRMGGGLTPDADQNTAALIRVTAQQRREVIAVDPAATTSASTLPLRNGDLLEISRLRPQLDSGVVVKGHVYRQKYTAWHEGLRLSEVFPSMDELMADADPHYILVRRELPPNRKIVAVSADLAAALQAPGSAADITLMPRDRITVFDKQSSRAWLVQPLMSELRLQASLSEPTAIVHVAGQVQVPGEYPLEAGMRVSDLIRAGGGLNPSAYAAQAEVARYAVENGDQRTTRVIPIDLSALRRGDSSSDIVLQPFDLLSVKQISGWTNQDEVKISGEVRFPGLYAIRPGETLQSVIRRSGGFTPFAFLDGSLFTREELKAREQEQLDRLAVRLRTEIAEVALMGVRAQQGAAPSGISVGEALLHQLSDAKAIGRLVIDLRAVMTAKPGSSEDVILRNGDQLIVPRLRQEVMVLGEVQDPTSHLYRRDLSRDDYIAQSGGPTRQADKSRIYVVRANGSVDSGSRGWFHNGDSVQIHPGDAIVVPLDTERLPPLTLYTAVSTILYNIAIAAAEAKGSL